MPELCCLHTHTWNRIREVKGEVKAIFSHVQPERNSIKKKRQTNSVAKRKNFEGSSILQKPNKQSGIFKSLGNIILFFFYKKGEGRRGGGGHYDSN